jgi:Pectate lyase superfamily protein/Major tropism determinant N-terminal domain
MAVIQISKIQVRRGAVGDEGMPQLSSGEMGWAIDTQQLFIGNGAVSEGAPAVGNTEILTTRSLFDAVATITSSTYTYSGHNTNVTLSSVVARTVGNKLDDTASILDFGAKEQTDITASLQGAIDDLYLNSDKNYPKSRTPLKLPAGTFYVSKVIYLPPYATIEGAGIDKTVLVNISTATNTTIFTTIDGTSTKINRKQGTNILSSSQPRNIKISGMTLVHTATNSVSTSTPLVVLDGVANSRITDVKFSGLYDHMVTAHVEHSAIELLGNLTNQVSIDNCFIENLCYPITSNEDITDISITNNTFKDLYQGITFAASLLGETPQAFGPYRVNIEDNLFKNIERQAIYAGANDGWNNQINSENNTFIFVGNGTNIFGTVNGDDKPVTPIITFASHGNSSVNDNFERLWYAQLDGYNKKQRAVIDGTAKVEIKFTDKRTLAISPDPGSPTTLIRVPYGYTATNVTVDYTIYKNDLARTGTLQLVAAPIGLINIRDNYTVAGNGSLDDVTFYANFLDTELIGEIDTIAVQYTNPTTTSTCVYNVSYYR